MKYWEHLQQVINYLNGKIDIYDGKHEATINTWNQAWDEMRWQGYDPNKAQGIKQYIAANK